MEREHDNGLIELGVASVATQGEDKGWPSEGVGYFPIGLTER
ncbi:MAG TPA: benenodin family lasso peptide [Allosphingosinicella sp.]|nr:benenodin family lasso peptide [Allosphingosinicella sp.]